MNSVMCVLGLCDATRRDEAEDANDARADATVVRVDDW